MRQGKSYNNGRIKGKPAYFNKPVYVRRGNHQDAYKLVNRVEERYIPLSTGLEKLL